MKKLTIDDLAQRFFKICCFCKREVISHNWLLDNGKCKWCDYNYYLKRKK